MTTAASPRWKFWAGFLIVTLLIAGGVSYLASSSPDGLDSATLQGCEVVDNNGTDELTGSCIAQHAADHHMASSPLADYSILGGENTGGIAGIIGVVITLAAAGALFWAIARSRSKTSSGE
jgi:cobalt/nickel transport protein